MGFYGNATYYLPNGIAQDVVDEVITTKKLAKDAVTASKIAETAIHGLSTGNNLEKDDQGNSIDKLDQDGKNVIRPSHFAKQTITGEGHSKKKRIVNSQGEIVDSTTNWEGDIALDTITGGSKVGEGNIAGGTIQGYNIYPQTIQGSGNSDGGNNLNKSHIGENTIGVSNMGKNSVDKEQIVNSSIHGCGDNEDYADYQHIAEGSIGTNDIANGAIQKEKISTTAITGLGSSEKLLVKPNDGESNKRPTHFASRTIAGENHAHAQTDASGNIITDALGNPVLWEGDIALDTITGGSKIGEGNIAENTIQQYNMADNSIGVDEIQLENVFGSAIENTKNHIMPGSIGTNDIANGAITNDKLNEQYLKYKKRDQTLQITNLNELINFCQTFPSQTIQRIFLSQQINYNNTIHLDQGYYFIIKESIWNFLLDLNKGKFYQLEIQSNSSYVLKTTQLNAENLVLNSILGGVQGHIAPNTIKEYNMDSNSINTEQVIANSIYGSGINGKKCHIQEKSIGTNDIANNVITGGSSPTEGNIAPRTIQNYNIAKNTIENDRLAENYYSHLEANSLLDNESDIKDYCESMREDQKLFFSISTIGNLYSKYGLQPDVQYCLEKRKDWIVYPINNYSPASYYLVSLSSGILYKQNTPLLPFFSYTGQKNTIIQPNQHIDWSLSQLNTTFILEYPYIGSNYIHYANGAVDTAKITKLIFSISGVFESTPIQWLVNINGLSVMSSKEKDLIISQEQLISWGYDLEPNTVTFIEIKGMGGPTTASTQKQIIQINFNFYSVATHETEN